VAGKIKEEFKELKEDLSEFKDNLDFKPKQPISLTPKALVLLDRLGKVKPDTDHEEALLRALSHMGGVPPREPRPPKQMPEAERILAHKMMRRWVVLWSRAVRARGVAEAEALADMSISMQMQVQMLSEALERGRPPRRMSGELPSPTHRSRSETSGEGKGLPPFLEELLGKAKQFADGVPMLKQMLEKVDAPLDAPAHGPTAPSFAGTLAGELEEMVSALATDLRIETTRRMQLEQEITRLELTVEISRDLDAGGGASSSAPSGAPTSPSHAAEKRLKQAALEQLQAAENATEGAMREAEGWRQRAELAEAAVYRAHDAESAAVARAEAAEVAAAAAAATKASSFSFNFLSASEQWEAQLETARAQLETARRELETARTERESERLAERQRAEAAEAQLEALRRRMQQDATTQELTHSLALEDLRSENSKLASDLREAILTNVRASQAASTAAPAPSLRRSSFFAATPPVATPMPPVATPVPPVASPMPPLASPVPPVASPVPSSEAERQKRRRTFTFGPGSLGVTFKDAGGFVIINQVTAGSQAAKQGVAAGSKLISVSGKPMEGVISAAAVARVKEEMQRAAEQPMTMELESSAYDDR
jgi:hypothetical protein